MYYLETKDVVKQFSGHRALDGVSLAVPQGCIYGLLGPNGAGKTTLIRIINRITAPDSGEVFFQGNLSQPDNIFKIGYLPEERGLYKKMKVGEHALFFARLKGVPKELAQERLNQWFQKFDIASWRNKKVEELSKGMQQKVQFITTIIHDPDLMIFDEPFSGFDPVNVELLKSEILELKAKGKTIILSTHNMESVEELCDFITLINRSQVVLQGKVSEVKQAHKKNIFRLRIAETEYQLPPSLSLLSEVKKENHTDLRLQNPQGLSSADILKLFIDRYQILAFEEELPSMNEIFIDTVTNKQAQQ